MAHGLIRKVFILTQASCRKLSINQVNIMTQKNTFVSAGYIVRCGQAQSEQKKVWEHSVISRTSHHQNIRPSGKKRKTKLQVSVWKIKTQLDEFQCSLTTQIWSLQFVATCLIPNSTFKNPLFDTFRTRRLDVKLS